MIATASFVASGILILCLLKAGAGGISRPAFGSGGAGGTPPPECKGGGTGGGAGDAAANVVAPDRACSLVRCGPGGGGGGLGGDLPLAKGIFVACNKPAEIKST